MSCPTPFYEEDRFPTTGGYVAGRWCRTVPTAIEDTSCCVPCPMASWIYSPDLYPKLEIASWLGVSVLALIGSLAITYAVFPVKDTSRHYLTTSPLIGFGFIAAAFVIPLISTPRECYNEITPNDWRTDATCAISGSFIIFGVWVVFISCFFRSLSLYLHLRWEIELGRRYMWFTLAVIFFGSLGLLIISILISGVSYQLGKICYINVHKGMQTLWGPLLGTAVLILMLQLMIIGYSVQVVLKPFALGHSWFAKDHRESIHSSASSTTRQASTRVLRILRIQWRAILIVILVLIHLAFICQMFLRIKPAGHYPLSQLMPWITCLVVHPGDKTQCLEYSAHLGPGESNVIAAMCLLSFTGFWGFVCVSRWSMVEAWVYWARTKIFRMPMPSQAMRLSSLSQPSEHECHQLGLTTQAKDDWPLRDPVILDVESLKSLQRS